MVLKLSLARLDVLIWVLVYGGLIGLALGLALRDAHSLLAGTVAVGGAAVAVLGVVLIFVRARAARSASLIPPERTP